MKNNFNLPALAITLLFCIISLGVMSQAPGIQWQRTIGGTLYDHTDCAITTSDGGSLIGGGSASGISGEKTQNSLGGWDYWVVKLDADGNIQWQNTIGGSADDFLQAFQQTSDGGYILGGYSPSNISGNKTENSKGGIDYWVVKLNAGGNIVWQKTIGGSGTDELFSVMQTHDGGYILGGYSNSNISGDKTQNSFGEEDYWIVKINAAGLIQWQKTIGGSSEDELYAMDYTSDGGFILGGYSASNISGNKTHDSYGGDDYWVVKTDSMGVIKWQKTIGGSGDDDLYSIRQNTGGGYLLGGFSNSDISGVKSDNSKGGRDYWVVKLSPVGNINWQKTIGGSSDDVLASLQLTSDGGSIASGASSSNISGDKTENSRGSSDYWIVKLNSSGNIQWQKTLGGSNYDNFYGEGRETAGGGFIVAGYSTSDSSGDKTENDRGFNDYWVIKLCAPCSFPSNLSYSNLTSTSVKLKWTKRDCAYGYTLQYRPSGTQTWINKAVNTNAGFKNITGLLPNTTYQWRIKTKCTANPDQFSNFSAVHTFSTPLRLAQSDEYEAAAYDLSIYPNPVYNDVTISFTLEKSENISLRIFDLNGRLIKTLSDQVLKNGPHELTWNINEQSGIPVGPGIYLFRMQTAAHVITKKLTVTK